MIDINSRFLVIVYPTFIYSGHRKVRSGILLEITDMAPINDGKTPITTRFTCPPEIDMVHGVAAGFISEITGINPEVIKDTLGIYDESFKETKIETL